jgi:hypothetical protein
MYIINKRKQREHPEKRTPCMHAEKLRINTYTFPEAMETK